MAGMSTTQVINGQSYTPYTPEWYAAQSGDFINRAGVSGTARGTDEANYLSKLSPSLQGLYSSLGIGGSSGTGSSSSSTPNTVNYGGSGSSTAPPASVNYGGFGGDSVSSKGLKTDAISTTPTATIAPLDLSKADTAAFATAKDQAAKTAGASMTGLQQALASRGMGGGGYEAGQIGNTLAREANTIGEAGRAQAVNDASLTAQGNLANLGAQVTQRGQDINSKQSDASRSLAAAEAAYSGDIAQRGQDIGGREAAAGFDVTQRGQDIGAGESADRLAADQAGTAYSGAITQRGQDISQQEAAATRAQQQATLRSQQTLAILQSVLGGKAPAYAY
jgi:hypothetical protein